MALRYNQMKHGLIALVAVLILGTGYWMFSNQSGLNEAIAPLEEKLVDTQTELATDVEVLDQSDEAVWRVVTDDIEVPTIPSYVRAISGAVLVDITSLRSSDWQVNDEIIFTIPQVSYTLRTRVEDIDEHVGGIVTLKSYPDETMFNHMLVTIGRENTFVNLFTPLGEYELVGNREYGWLVPSRSLGPQGTVLDDIVPARETTIGRTENDYPEPVLNNE